MKKTYLLGIPLFNLVFCLVFSLELWLFHQHKIHNPGVAMAPSTFAGMLFVALLMGGYCLVGLGYGLYLFSRHGGTTNFVAAYSVATFLLVTVIQFIQNPLLRDDLFLLVPAIKQTVGFCIGAGIALLKRRT